MKIIITETQNKTLLKRLRRLQELRDSIEYQIEIHDPCNFEDGEEFADFCIGEGINFFYGDEGYEEDDYTFADEDENEDNGRKEIEKLMYDEYYDGFVSQWEEWSDDCDDDDDDF